jgi:hypothetical protein
MLLTLTRIPILAVLVGLLVGLVPRVAQAEEDIRVYIVTMYPGDALFTGFGHIAFRIEDSSRGLDDVYDYGTYDAEDPLLGWKFLVGTLPYYCQHTSFDDMVAWYKNDFGGIEIRELNLTAEQIDRLKERVAYDCLPENAAYAYHHFYNNCATKIRDILDELLGGTLGAATKEQLAGRSLRDLIEASMARWQFAITRWAVFGLLNWEIDKPATRWEQMFLPYYLSVELDELSQPDMPGNPPLVIKRELVVGEQKGPPELPTSTFGVIFAFLLLLISLTPSLLPPGLARRASGLLIVGTGVVGGIYGTVLVFSWAVSPYPETAATMTLLVLHPLHWLLIPAGIGVWRGKERWRYKTTWYVLVGGVISALAVVGSLSGVVPQRIWLYGVGACCLSLGLAATLRLTRAHFK